MQRTFFYSIINLIFLIFISVEVAFAKDCEISVGIVPQFEQRKLFTIWSPILNYLTNETECQFTFIPSDTIGHFEKTLNKGDFDLAYMNPYHFITASKSQNYTPIIRSQTKKLEGVLVVSKESPIQEIEQLDGVEIAFPSPNAFAASLLIRSELKHKYNLNFTPRYVKNHSSVYIHVAKNITQAGGGVIGTLNRQNKAIQNKLRILYRATPSPGHPLAVHPRIGNKMREKIQKAFLKLAAKNVTLTNAIPMPDLGKASAKDYQILENLNLIQEQQD